jgi:hypothetical protein
MEITNRGAVRSAQADACFLVGKTKKGARPGRNRTNVSFSMTRLPFYAVGSTHNDGTCDGHINVLLR